MKDYASRYYTRAPLKFDDINFTGHFYEGFVWPVISSRTGEEYGVTLTAKGFTCSCIGFERFGKCKHITGIHDQLVSDEDDPKYS